MISTSVQVLQPFTGFELNKKDLAFQPHAIYNILCCVSFKVILVNY